MDRTNTGILELDTLIGGFPAGKTVFVTGDPGTGKTIFGLQFANSSCMQELKTVYISTEENAVDIKQQGKSFEMNLEGYEKKGLLKFIELASSRAMEIETALTISLDNVKGNFEGMLDYVPKETQVLIIDSLGTHAANLTPYEFRDRFDLLLYDLGVLQP